MLCYTDNSIRVAKRLNAQGLIVWNVEGQEMRHPIGYPQGCTGTPAEVREVYPDAFTVLRVVDGSPLEAPWAELKRAVAAGDIQLFRARWSDPVNDQVKRLYDEAAPPAGR